jgi:hypothetical protein
LGLVVVLAILFLVAFQSKGADTPDNDSIPELVEVYVTMPCGFLHDSTRFLGVEVEHIAKRYVKCQAWVAEHEVEYGAYLCGYVELERQFAYEHLKSVEKAYDIMCEDGTKKNPEFEIHF